MPGKTTLHALSFDPRKFQFLAKFGCFPTSLKQARCVRGYGISTVAYTRYVHGFPEDKSCTLCEVGKSYVGLKIKFCLDQMKEHGV